MKPVYIYALVCPISNEIRYIGKTIQLLKNRLKCHLTPTKNDLTHRANWIRELKNKGLKPSITLIEECNENVWVEKEIYWIDYYSKLFNLTNHTKGGNGGHDVKISTKEQYSIKAKERWKNDEYREKMVNTIKDLWSDKEHKELMSDKAKERWQNETYKNNMIQMSKRLWQDENYRLTRLTTESKQKMSDSHLGKKHSQEHKNKISNKSKEMWSDFKLKNKIIEKRLKAVIVDGVKYNSMADAAKELKLNPSTITRRIKSEKFPNYVLN